MTDSTLGFTPGSGANVATRTDGSGAHHQKMLLEHLQGGVPTAASPTNPIPVDGSYGELIEAVEALRVAVASLTKSIGFALPNLLGQPIMEARQATAANLAVTASIASGQTLGTVTTLATLTNQSQIGGYAANDQIPALMHLQADGLRANITVT